MPFDSIESVAKKLVVSVQEYAILTGRAIGNIFLRPRYFADFITQADSIGIGSVPIVLLTGFGLFYDKSEFPDIDVLASKPVRIPALREAIATATEAR